MRGIGPFVVGITIAGLAVCPARAVCLYNGQLYAKTTLAEEFADSHWVVKAKVVATDDRWSDESDPWTIYHLRVLTVFKGHPPFNIDLFTYRNSGGFYLDRGVSHDIGGVFLLYLDPVMAKEDVPVAARGAVQVNYACGQSKPWRDVERAERQRLITLSVR